MSWMVADQAHQQERKCSDMGTKILHPTCKDIPFHMTTPALCESWTAQMQPLQSNQRMKSSGGFFARQLNHKQFSSLACSTWKKWHCSTYHEFQPLQNALMQSSSLLRGPQVVLLLPRALPHIPATSLQHPHVSQVTKYYSPQRIWACCNGSFESEKTFSDMIAGAKDKIPRRRRRTRLHCEEQRSPTCLVRWWAAPSPAHPAPTTTTFLFLFFCCFSSSSINVSSSSSAAPATATTNLLASLHGLAFLPLEYFSLPICLLQQLLESTKSFVVASLRRRGPRRSVPDDKRLDVHRVCKHSPAISLSLRFRFLNKLQQEGRNHITLLHNIFFLCRITE